MKKILYIFFAGMSIFFSSYAFAVTELSSNELKNSTIPNISSSSSKAGSTVSSSTASQSGMGFLDAILAFVRDTMFYFLALVAIGVFLWIGAKLIVARGNQEEFSKALKAFIYAIIGIFFVAIAWVLIKFIAGLEIF